MKPVRKLALKKETLSELSSDELRDIAAARNAESGTTCPVKDCLNSRYNCPPTWQSCLPTCYCTPVTH